MLIPVRCFSCGKPVAEYYEEYAQRVEKGEDKAKILDSLGITRYCCRRMMLSHVDLIDEILPYPRF
ncbi:MAG: DNA-directed RNA polymerase subunit N [Candidatus Micrarchaeota archaeon]